VGCGGGVELARNEDEDEEEEEDEEDEEEEEVFCSLVEAVVAAAGNCFTLATAAWYLLIDSALLGFCCRYAAQASRMAKLGVSCLCGMVELVMGLVSWSRNHSSMTCLSNVCPSAVNTGSRMTS